MESICVAEEFNARRCHPARRPDVDNAAPHRELANSPYRILAHITCRNQLVDQIFRRLIVVFGKHTPPPLAISSGVTVRRDEGARGKQDEILLVTRESPKESARGVREFRGEAMSRRKDHFPTMAGRALHFRNSVCRPTRNTRSASRLPTVQGRDSLV